MVTVDECYGCGGFFLDAGELELVRKYHMTENERDQCIQKILSDFPNTHAKAVNKIIPGTKERRKAVYNVVNSIFNLS